jgi:predicted peptidase
MGGYGTWSLAIEYPERFAALVPVAGGYATGDPQDACKLKRVPIWVFHGAKDTRVDPSESEVMVDALKGCGGNVRFTLFPDEGHDDHMWARVYDDPELYDWLLQQVKAETTPAPSASATPVPTSNSHYELVVGSHPRIPTRIRE